MANQAPDLESILAALGNTASLKGKPYGTYLTSPTASQRPPTSTPSHPQSGLPASAAAPASYAPPAHNPYASQAPPYQQAPGSYGYPAPSSSGNLDLSSIKPVNSGTVTIADAIAQAKAFATKNGATPYEHSGAYPSKDSRGPDNRSYGRSRSRSPPARRDAFRDNFNPYRDERREDRGPQSREYGRDRSLSPGPRGGRQGFSPRGGSGPPRDRSPRGGDDNTETMEIESSLVGLIIGRQGENLRRVEQDTHSRVQFVPASSPHDQMRTCRITGPRARRREAVAAINRIIEDSGMGAVARAGLDSGRNNSRGPAQAAQAAPLKDGEENLQIMVPDRTVGLIIGRGGETIRDLQERSGCHVNIVGENKSVNGLRPVNLIGTPEAAMHAKDLILEIVESDSRNGGQGGNRPPPRHDNMRDGGGGGAGGVDKVNDSIYVPSEAVGMIIGKGGETIREMQNNTGCKINVSQSSGPGEVEREIGLVGSRDAINRAKLVIEEKVEAVVSVYHLSPKDNKNDN